MFCLRSHALTLILLGLALPAWPQAPSGRLVAGCGDGDAPASLSPAERERYCRSIVRFRRYDAGTKARPPKSAEQSAVESVLGDLIAIQPAQIDGDRASVLVQRNGGEFAVVSLARSGDVWKITAILNAGAVIVRRGS
jgi:hypothetical protein